MATPNSIDQLTDTQTEPTTDEFGTNVGEKILEQTEIAAEQSDQSTAIEPQQSGWRATHCNIGANEQKIRLGAGAALLAAAAFAPVGRNWKIGLAALGVAQLVTGATNYCPLWQAIGVNTRK